jgi:hypothetical protein
MMLIALTTLGLLSQHILTSTGLGSRAFPSWNLTELHTQTQLRRGADIQFYFRYSTNAFGGTEQQCTRQC